MFKRFLFYLLFFMPSLGLCAQLGYDLMDLSTQDCVESILATTGQDVNIALLEAVKLNRVDVVQALLYKNPTNINKAIELAKLLKYKDVEKVLVKWKKLKAVVSNLAGLGIVIGGLYGVAKVAEYGLYKILHWSSYDKYEDAVANRKLLEQGVSPLDLIDNNKYRVDKVWVSEDNVLPSVSSAVDNAIKVVDSLPEKKEFFMKDPAWKEAVFVSQFRHQDWVTTLMGHGKTLDEMSPTEAAMQMIKCKQPSRLQKYCKKQNIDMAPLVGNYGSFECVAQQVSQFEHAMKEKGFITLVHARKSDWGFVNDMWNMILAVKDNKNVIPEDVHFRQRDDTFDLAKLKQYRKELIRKGSHAEVVSAINQDEKHSELTFCNRTFISNMNLSIFEGYSAQAYYYGNRSWSDKGFENKSIEHLLELLKKHNLSEFETDIKELHALHKSVYKRGQVVCIGIDKDKFDHMVYRAKDLGYKADNTYSFDGKKHQDLPRKASEAMKVFDEKMRDTKNKFIEKYDLGDSQQFYCAVGLGATGEGSETVQYKTIAEPDEDLQMKYVCKRNELFEKIKRSKGQQVNHHQRDNDDLMGQLCFN